MKDQSKIIRIFISTKNFQHLKTICSTLDNDQAFKERIYVERRLCARRVAEWLHKRNLIGPRPDQLDPSDLLTYRTYHPNIKSPNKDYSGSIRAYFIAKVYHYLKGGSFEKALENERLMDIIAMGEICITIMYLENHYLDRKFGTNSPKTIAINRAEKRRFEKMLKNHAELYLSDQKSIDIYGYLQNKLFYNYDIGNIIDSELICCQPEVVSSTKYHNFEKKTTIEIEIFSALGDLKMETTRENKKILYDTTIDLVNQLTEGYLPIYLLRSFLINAIFYSIFTQILLLVETSIVVTDEQKNALKSFSQTYGLVQQIINDIQDFFPQEKLSTKFPEDTQSDFRRRLITLPIAFFLSQTKENSNLSPIHTEMYDFLTGKIEHSTISQEEIVKAIRYSNPTNISFGALDCSFTAVRNMIINAAARFEVLARTEPGKELLTLPCIAYKSRFLKEYKKKS
ncbi:MAG: hypothetical protein NWR72_16210 [Bacteroidia bacterium]|nr:hypothetical protein [Bacteroidia bacterium]